MMLPIRQEYYNYKQGWGIFSLRTPGLLRTPIIVEQGVTWDDVEENGLKWSRVHMRSDSLIEVMARNISRAEVKIRELLALGQKLGAYR